MLVFLFLEHTHQNHIVPQWPFLICFLSLRLQAELVSAWFPHLPQISAQTSPPWRTVSDVSSPGLSVLSLHPNFSFQGYHCLLFYYLLQIPLTGSSRGRGVFICLLLYLQHLENFLACDTELFRERTMFIIIIIK